MGEVSSEGFAQPWVEFEKQVGGRLKLWGPTIDEIFQQYGDVGTILVSKLQYPAPDLSVTTEDKEISLGLKVRIYTPPNYPGNRPAALFYHGGGWAMGDLNGEDSQVRTICKDSGVVIVAVDYRLAPKYPYPEPLDDCVTAYEWVLKNSASLNTTPNRVFTFGTSAGGNLALSSALRVVDAGLGETLLGVVAVVPVTVDPEHVPDDWKKIYNSYEEHAENTINTKRAMKVFFDAYAGDGKDPFVSPLLHKRLKDLKKVYLVGCGQDTLRDDARLFKMALDAAGVPNIFDEYQGYPHFWWTFPSEHLVKAVAEFNKNLTAGFAFVLS